MTFMGHSRTNVILMVTKDTHLKASFSKTLCQNGHKQLVSNHDEAKKMFKMFIPKIIFIDQALPNGQAEKLISECHQNYPELNIIFLIDQLSEDCAFRIFNKVTELLRKPVLETQLREIYERYCVIPASSTDPCPIVSSYISLQYTDPNLTQKRMAQDIGLSPEHLCRVFKAKTGRSFHKTLSDRRIKAATKLLLNTDLLVKQVAYKVGYTRDDVFIKNFQKAIGISPEEYRKNSIRKTTSRKILVS